MIVKKTHLRWYAATGIFAFLLILGLLFTASLEDTPFSNLGWDFWRSGLQGPTIIVYILLIYPILTRIGDNAIDSMIPLLDMSNAEFDIMESKYHAPSRLGEWISLSLGTTFVLILSQPWHGNVNLHNVFLFIIELIMFGLLALLIYYGFRDARYITLVNKKLKLDLFKVNALAPIARWSLSISLAFVGGIIISILFQTNLMQWQTILIYIILVVSTIAIFFISMWSAHIAIVNVKRRELNLVQEKLSQACRKLTQETFEGHNANSISSNLHYEVAAWALYERRIRETKEWPYNAGIIGQLVISILSSGVIYIIKLISGNLSGF